MPVRLEYLVANRVTKILSRNPNRLSFTIKNDSATDLYYGYDLTVATSGYKQGFKVAAGGDSAYDEHHKGDVYAVCTTGVDVTVTEDVKPIEKPKVE